MIERNISKIKSRNLTILTGLGNRFTYIPVWNKNAMQSQFLAKMSQSLKHTLNYFSGNPNLSSQLKLQKFDKAGSIIGQRKANLSLKSVLLFMANSGVVRWSLITMLPFIVLAIFSSQVKFTHSTEVITLFSDFFCIC